MTVRIWRGQPAQLGGDAVHGALRLGVGVEQVAGDQEEVDLLGDREVDGGLERRELALTLGRRGFAEVGVTCAEVDVRGVEQSEHPVAEVLLSRRARGDEARWRRPARPEAPLSGPGLGASEAPPGSSLATPVLAGHCDRSGVTGAGGMSLGDPLAADTVSEDFRAGYSPPARKPVRPETGTPHRHLDSAAPAFPTLLAMSRPPMPSPRRPAHSQRRGRLVTYADRTLTCVDCGVEFIHSAADQEYYAQKGFVVRPEALR